tara:strand:- start:997 stop:1302 length:306 start_codon:yes stop_codon:yes gene_type:complete
MKTKDKVKYYLDKYPSLKDDDNRLCSNIWLEELNNLNVMAKDNFIFLKLYAENKLTSAPSIKRARAKLQEEEPKYRGDKYNLRKGILQDKWRKDLGYEKNN